LILGPASTGYQTKNGSCKGTAGKRTRPVEHVQFRSWGTKNGAFVTFCSNPAVVVTVRGSPPQPRHQVCSPVTLMTRRVINLLAALVLVLAGPATGRAADRVLTGPDSFRAVRAALQGASPAIRSASWSRS